jgi:tetratricopeptide (TPR) repeat protein
MVPRSADEEADSDEGTDDEDTDPVVTRTEEFDDDSDLIGPSGIPIWAVEAETERVRVPIPPDAFPPPATKPDPARNRNADKEGEGAEARATTFFDLGIALEAQHRYAEALEACEQALKLSPADPIYRASVKRLRALLRS